MTVAGLLLVKKDRGEAMIPWAPLCCILVEALIMRKKKMIGKAREGMTKIQSHKIFTCRPPGRKDPVTVNCQHRTIAVVPMMPAAAIIDSAKLLTTYNRNNTL